MNFGKNNHPGLEQISDLAGPDQSVEAAVFEHVSGCSDCNVELRSVKQSLSRLRLSYAGEVLHASSEHLDDDTIKDYVKERSNAERVKAHMAECESCRQAVLLYRAQRLESQAQNQANSVKTQNTFEYYLEQLVSAVKWKNDWAVPFWLGIPLGAVASVIFVLLLFFITPSADENGNILVSFRDDPHLYWMEEAGSTPMMGFSGKVPLEKLRFDTVRIDKGSATNVRIQWDKIKGVESYKLSIYQAATPKDKLIFEGETRDNAITVKMDFTPGQRYIWQISGSKDDKYFITQGGFLFSQ